MYLLPTTIPEYSGKSRRLIFFLIISCAWLGTVIPVYADSRPSGFDRLWDSVTWSAERPDAFIQRMQFTGRLQVDITAVDADIGDHSDVTIRRLRSGGIVSLRGGVTLHVEGEFNPEDPDPLFKRLTDTYIAWKPDPRFELVIGKQGAAFTMDGQTSSKELLAIDRSNLSNNLWFPEEYIPGVTVAGDAGNWRYNAGIFSSGAADRGLGDFSGGTFYLATLGHDLSGRLGADEALVRVNYIHNRPDEDNTFTRSLENVASVNFSYEAGSLGVRADLSGAEGYLGQPDLLGLMIMPFYNFTGNWQLVGRLTRVESDEDNGVRFGRYESALTGGRGDRYDEAYIGLNYYFYGHKLKLQNGLHHARMRDRAGDGGEYSGWSWTTGLRLSW